MLMLVLKPFFFYLKAIFAGSSKITSENTNVLRGKNSLKWFLGNEPKRFKKSHKRGKKQKTPWPPKRKRAKSQRFSYAIS